MNNSRDGIINFDPISFDEIKLLDYLVAIPLTDELGETTILLSEVEKTLWREREKLMRSLQGLMKKVYAVKLFDWTALSPFIQGCMEDENRIKVEVLFDVDDIESILQIIIDGSSKMV